MSFIGTAKEPQGKSNAVLNADTVEGLKKIYKGRSGDQKTRFTELQLLVSIAHENERTSWIRSRPPNILIYLLIDCRMEMSRSISLQ
jgi:hypothetical protein